MYKANKTKINIRKTLLFLFLIIVCIIFIIYQKKHPETESKKNTVYLHTIAPILNKIHLFENKIASIIEWFFTINSLNQNIKDLEKNNTILTLQNRELSEENRKLTKQLTLVEGANAVNYKYIISEIVSISSSPWSKAIVVDKGKKDGVKQNMAAINQEGLVGLVREADEKSSIIGLLIDEKFAVSVMTKKTGIYGIAKGTGETNLLELYLEEQSTQLDIGEEVITSGLDNSLFIKGISIGTVSNREKNKFGIYEYKIKPSVNFNKIEFVLLIEEENAQ